MKVKKRRTISATVKLDDEFEIQKLRMILAYYISDGNPATESKESAKFAYELWKSLVKLGET